MKRMFVVLVAFVLAIALLTACAPREEVRQPEPERPQEPVAQQPEEDVQSHAFVFKNTGNPFGERLMEGFRNAIEEQGHEAILRAPDLPTVEGQIMIIEELIAQRVASISIAANDRDALQPVLQKAMDAGIKILSSDSPVNHQSRTLHINQADPERIGRTLVRAIYDMIGGSGEIAILSATSVAANQNLWIEWMMTELEDPKYAEVRLVDVVYGDDLRDKSVSEAEGLLRKHPDLKGIISPTTVGIAATGRVLTDEGLKDVVHLTGLGLPSEMAEYIESGVCDWMYLWNPIDLGYLTGYAAMALADGTITGAVGDSFTAGALGEREIIQDDGGTQVMLGDPFRFDAGNINDWKEVY